MLRNSIREVQETACILQHMRCFLLRKMKVGSELEVNSKEGYLKQLEFKQISCHFPLLFPHLTGSPTIKWKGEEPLNKEKSINKMYQKKKQ